MKQLCALGTEYSEVVGSHGRRRKFVNTAISSIALLLLATALAQGQAGKKPVEVSDAIRMNRLADPEYFYGNAPNSSVATFSPNGQHYVVVLRHGNLARNTNDYSLYLFSSTNPAGSVKPERLLTMSSSSNRDAIRNVSWMADSNRLVFIGEMPGKVGQIYEFNMRSRELLQLTRQRTPIVNYQVRPDGQRFVYLAEPPHGQSAVRHCIRDEIVITRQRLTDLLAGKDEQAEGLELFVKSRKGQPIRLLPATELSAETLSLSPDGLYALVSAHIDSNDLPSDWTEYEYQHNEYIHAFFHGKNPRAATSPFIRYFAVNLRTGLARIVNHAPSLGAARIAWSPRSDALFFKGIYLPLDNTTGAEREARITRSYDARISLATGEYQVLHEEDWPKSSAPSQPLRVTLEEDMNTPARVFATDSLTGSRSMILDLNPQFSGLDLGSVKEIEWRADGVELEGGLYLPREYQPGVRYPLVIQTHGFDSSRFSIDGLDEWSSGFAARPLASHGFVVLQAYAFKNREDHDRVGNDRRLGATQEQSFKRFNAAAYLAGIAYLDRMGMISPEDVGIIGFSRTVCFVANLLTHSEFKFGAVILTDGIDCGYFQYLAFDGGEDMDLLNGGSAPFGEGLQAWLSEAPGFNLDKVTAPVRIVAIGRPAILSGWEWFSGLTLQNKPVDFVDIPGGVHLLQRPRDRQIAMQGIVDWFCFWLKNEQDHSPNKIEQYARWERMRLKLLRSREGREDHSRETSSIH